MLPIKVLWGQSIHYLGTWTLRALYTLNRARADVAVADRRVCDLARTGLGRGADVSEILTGSFKGPFKGAFKGSTRILYGFTYSSLYLRARVYCRILFPLRAL